MKKENFIYKQKTITSQILNLYKLISDNYQHCFTKIQATYIFIGRPFINF